MKILKLQLAHGVEVSAVVPVPPATSGFSFKLEIADPGNPNPRILTISEPQVTLMLAMKQAGAIGPWEPPPVSNHGGYGSGDAQPADPEATRDMLCY